MKYYSYEPEADGFAGIGFDLGEFRSPEEERVLGIHYVDHSVHEGWIPPTAHRFEDEGPQTEGDFPTLFNYSKIPVMSQRAWKALRPLIGYCCEALPIIHPTGRPYFMIHVMETIDCLDAVKSDLTRNATTGRVNRIYHYAFQCDMLLNKHIFKLPLESGAGLIVDDEFRKAVEANGLKGLQFKELSLVK